MKKNTTKAALLLAGAALALGTALPVPQALAATKTVAPATLDRAQLLQLADSYLAAVVAHDPAKVPLAADVKVVENVTRIKPGEGLWKTASGGVTDFKIVVADPYSQEVGGLVVMQSDGKPAQVGFRLKLDNGKIVQAEHMVVYPRETSMVNLQKARPTFAMEIPYEYRDSRGRLIHIAKSYYDALDNNNGYLAPFADDCERHENGFRTAPNGGPSLAVPNIPAMASSAPRPVGLQGLQTCATQINSGAFQYIDTIDDRRVEVADEVTGLALGFSHFHHEMKEKDWPLYNDPSREVTKMDFKPFDLPAMHIFKIWGGQIHEIEAIGISVPYNSPSGWEETAPAAGGQ